MLSQARVLRDWRTKALLQQGISLLPASQKVNYLFQRRVTKRLPVPQHELEAAPVTARDHLGAYASYVKKPPAEATFYEFGTGWDLRVPIAFFALGVGHQILVDLRPLARPELVDDVLLRLPAVCDFDQAGALALANATKAALEEEDVVAKARHLAIDYRAPCDARRTGLPDRSVDCITSTSTLEHIPPDDLAAILRECHRLLTDEGVMSCFIDYSDHYSTFDRTITAYNFLRYSDRRWRLFNSALNYQNRLQHSEYLALARDAGFEIAENHPSEVEAAELDNVGSVPLATKFRQFTREDLAITSAHLVLLKH